MIQTPVASLCRYETTILTIATNLNIWRYLFLSAGSVKQANAAEMFILSKQETVFQTGQLQVRKKTAYQWQQARKTKPHQFIQKEKQCSVTELLFTKCLTETWSTFLSNYINPPPKQLRYQQSQLSYWSQCHNYQRLQTRAWTSLCNHWENLQKQEWIVQEGGRS